MIGFLVVDKEPGWTSHDVVARVRRITGERRVGHAGTLDPGATGVLVVAVGPATRLLRYLSGADKEYRGEVVLGATTTTLDDEGEVTGTFDMAGVTLAQAKTAAARLTGTIDQQVPMVSAVKVGGRRLHRLAREGTRVEPPVRSVTVEHFEVAEGPEPGTLAIEVTCSAGTYVRALAADLGAALGGGAHLRRLRRTRSGAVAVTDARTLEEIAAAVSAEGAAALRTPLEVLDLSTAAVDRALAVDVSHGRPVPLAALGGGTGPIALTDGAGNLLAVYEREGERAKAAVVLAPASRSPGPHDGPV